MAASTVSRIRFGEFEIDTAAGELRKNGAPVKLAPQPYRLLLLLASNPGRLVTRDEIRAALWPGETYVDFDQGVNFAIRQVRDALGDDAERPLYVQTVPRRGYRFIAPLSGGGSPTPRRGLTDLNLHKALWENIVELRLAESRRRRVLIAIAALLALLIAVVIFRL